MDAKLWTEKTVKNTNPFNAPGSPIAKLKPQGDQRLKLIMAAVVAATVLLFSGLFIQGCQRQPATNASNDELPGSTNPTTPTAPAFAEPSGAATTNGTVAGTAPDTSGSAAAAAPANNQTPSDTVTQPAAPATKDYVVVKGDSCYKIAHANHITTAALIAANPGVDSAKLKIGQTLHLPIAAETAAAPGSAPSVSATAPDAATAPAAPATTAADKAASGSTSKYVVKSGDTLGRIAKKHGVSVKALKAANGLTNDRIAVGKTLKLPAGKSASASA